MSASQGDRSEKPTLKRKRDARARGQIAISRDLGAAFALLAATLSIGWLGAWMVSAVGWRLAEGLRRLSETGRADLTTQSLGGAVWPEVGLLASVAGPPAAVALVTVVVTGLVQSGWTFAPKALALNWNRLSPSAGFARFKPLQAGGDLVKALVGLAVLVAVSAGLVMDLYGLAPGLVGMTPSEIGRYSLDRMFGLLWRAGLALAVVAAADYGLQYWRWFSQLRMTRQEVKDEFRLNEGNPEIKARVRRIQREMTRRRMLHAVKDATVVVTNPTHFAVALRYTRSGMSAPVVVAKGQDLMAARIKAVAARHGVPCVENVALARALYKSADVGDFIPHELFGAVAEVLAYLVRLKQIVL